MNAIARHDPKKIERERAIAIALREWRWSLKRIEIARSKERRCWAELQNLRAADARMLSTRERQVFDLMVAGCSHKQIAAALSITLRTAKFHASSIYRKLRVTDRAALLRG